MAGKAGVKEMLLREFMASPRIKAKYAPNGTKPVDIKVFREAITQVLSNSKFIVELGKQAIKEQILK